MQRAAAFAVLLITTLCTAPAAQGPLSAGPPSVRAAGTSEYSVTQTFGEPGGIGFRIEFDRRGAIVRNVRLLDQYEHVEVEGERHELYVLVREESAGPQYPGRYFGWLDLHDDRVEPSFPGVAGGLAAAVWTVAAKTADKIAFRLDCGAGLTLEKSFTHEPGRRDLLVEIALIASSERDAAGPGVHRVRLDGLALVSPKRDYVFGANSARAAGGTIDQDGAAHLEFAAADGTPPAEASVVAVRPSRGRIDFAGSTNRFFCAFLYPVDEAATDALYRVDMWKVPTAPQDDMPPYTLPQPRYHLSLHEPPRGGETRLKFRIYMGPKSFRVFDENPEYARFVPVVERDLNSGCFCSIPGAQQIAYFLLWLLSYLHDLVGNWGIAIMILTLIVRSAISPVNFRAQKAMRAYGARVAKFKPKLDALQKKYENDKKALQQEMVKFQREHKMFPPIGGCLPMFLPFPVFIGLFSALRVAYELRQQPFFWWIHDLSRPDELFVLGWSFLPYFNLLPIVMVGMWWWLQSGTPLPNDPQQRQMMKIMRWMPLVMGVMLYNYASGLMVYMITSSIFGLCEQRVTRRILGPISPDAAGLGATPMM